MTDYQPIPCHIHAELEVAIMHQIRMRVAWHTIDGKTRMEQLLPVDIRAREQEEFLLAEDSHGYPLEIRLDRIARFAPL
jgi:transcriptional antiterminator Rof (Rho-off)